jgi:hypothetical protein
VPVEEISCCGASCGTCRAYMVACTGCGIGYQSGERDIAKVRCEVLGAFRGKTGYKYGKYRQALEFIRQDGYESFL